MRLVARVCKILPYGRRSTAGSLRCWSTTGGGRYDDVGAARRAQPRRPSSAASTACARRATLRGFTAVVDHAALGGATEALIELFYAPGRLARRGRRDAARAPRGRRGVVRHRRRRRDRARPHARQRRPRAPDHATSSATGASCARARRSSSARWSSAEQRPGGVVPGDAAHAAAAPRARAAEPDVRVGRLHAPARRRPPRPRRTATPGRGGRCGRPGRRSSLLEVDRRPGLEARPPVGVAPEQVLDRLGQDVVERAQRGRDGGVARAVGVGAEEPRGEVQREARQGLGARGAQLGPRIEGSASEWQ